MYDVQVLAVNAAKDATELVAKLRAYHHTAQTKADKKHLSRYCLLDVVHSQPVALGLCNKFLNTQMRSNW